MIKKIIKIGVTSIVLTSALTACMGDDTTGNMLPIGNCSVSNVGAYVGGTTASIFRFYVGGREYTSNLISTSGDCSKPISQFDSMSLSACNITSVSPTSATTGSLTIKANYLTNTNESGAVNFTCTLSAI